MDSPTASLREEQREDMAREKAEKANRGKASQKELPVSTPASTKSGHLNGHANGTMAACPALSRARISEELL